MATLGAIGLTYADWLRRTDADGKIARIIEILSQTNEILEDAIVLEANESLGHRTTVRTGLPSATWRQFYQGVQPTKSTTAQVTDAIGMLETYSRVDKKLADLNGNTPAFRLSEDLAFLEGMNQQMASVVFYGNTGITPEKFQGFAPRYPTVNTATANTAVNVLDMGGTGSTNTSIWGVTWSPVTCHFIFPKGAAKGAGLHMEDKGDIRPGRDANGNEFEAYTTHYSWDNGLTVRDWRYVFRLCNIDVTTLSGGSPPNLINGLIRGVHKMPAQPTGAGTEQTTDAPDEKVSMGQVVIYGNRTVRTWLDIQALNKTNVLLQFENWHGKAITTFRGIPIKTCDALLNTEARVV